MQIFRKNESAVSPVIGVMLMIIVTVILAAAVSGFSGGLAGDTTKPAQLTIEAEYSQTNGLTITHMGGDVVNTIDTKIVAAATSDFGTYQQLRWQVDTTNVTIGTKPWYNPSLYSSGLARTFEAGDVAEAPTYAVQPRTYATTAYLNDSVSTYYGFDNVGNVGQRFNLLLVDSDGRTIAKTEVVIQP